MNLLYAFLGVIIAPLAGILIAGADRILTAKFQARTGPPLLQPLYDIAKLWGKQPMIAHRFQPLCVYVYLTAAMASVGLFFCPVGSLADLLCPGSRCCIPGDWCIPGPLSFQPGRGQPGVDSDFNL